MPVPTKPDALLYVHKARQQELDLMVDSATLAAGVQRDLALCNAEQHAIFEEIVAARTLPPTAVKCYFIYASGGCGKTFLLDLILREFRAAGHIAIATAFTGIAATVEEWSPCFRLNTFHPEDHYAFFFWTLFFALSKRDTRGFKHNHQWETDFSTFDVSKRTPHPAPLP